MKKSLAILVDGFYYVYSIYYGFPNLKNSIGEPTGVIYGFINILRNLFIKYRPKYMVVVFDASGSTFRNDLFRDYKLFRRPMPIDLYIQLPAIYKIIKAMGISVMIIPRVEADDVIGTLSLFFSNILNHYVYIFSGDKDMMQLVTHNIYVINTRFNIMFTEEVVKKNFGVPPNLMIDYLSLLGDISDNIPGVPGIGKVTAKFLLQKLGDLSLIYENLDKVSVLVGLKRAKLISLKLEKYRSLAFLSYKLVSIKKNVLLDVSSDDLLIKSYDIDLLMLLFRRYEFKRWLKVLSSGEWLI